MKHLILSVLSLLAFFSCKQSPQVEVIKYLSDTPLIPKPVDVQNDSGYLFLGSQIKITPVKTMQKSLVELMTEEWPVDSSSAPQTQIETKIAPSFTREQYRLTILSDRILMEANDSLGFLWAWMSLQQIVQLGADTTIAGIAIPTGTMTDYPQYAYRGMMLDIARHFFNPIEIKRIIDEISVYKINRLHLHLADDQGWRIEIKSWPKLTEIGGSVEVGSSLEIDERKGGYLTQKEYSELVRYAASKGITIIPEIDMPGHTNAALASYPALNCDGLARELYTGTQVGFSSLCVDKELTYQFIGDVIREISAITPGPYFHIGGDESHATSHEDYLYFINRVKDSVKSYNKQLIGWDEIAAADIDDNSIVQVWAHQDMAIIGLEKGAGLLFSPASKAYLDMKYDSSTVLGLNWAGYINLQTAYNWSPSDFLSKAQLQYVIGIEAPLWSETVSNITEAEYMIFPRITAYAEIGWSSIENKELKNYLGRVRLHQPWWKASGINSFMMP